MYIPPAFGPWSDLIHKAERQVTAGLTDEAIQTLTEALTWIETHDSTQAMLRVHTTDSIAATLSDSGRPEEALTWYERSIGVLRGIEGGNGQIEVANSLASYAKALLKAGRLTSSKEAVGECCAIYRKYLGERHPYIAIVGLTLARIEQREGNHATALAIARQSIDVLGEHADHLDSLISALHEAGRAELALGRLDDAELSFRESLRRGESLLLEWQTQEVALDLADTLAAKGSTQEARDVAWQAIGVLERVLPSLSPQLLGAKRRLETLLAKSEERDEANLVAAATSEDLLEDLNLANRRWRHLYRS
jgi:tetratricopeptide (TPR) repeat protein